MGGRTVGRCAAGRLGRRRHQGRSRRPATRCAACSARSASTATCRTRPSPSTTGASAASCSTCAEPRRPAAPRGAAGHGRRLHQQPPARRPRRARPRARRPPSARHPHLVYCSISGYGLRGEDRNRPTYDIGAFWARSGLSDADGRRARARRSTPAGGIGDHITGLAALAGLLAAVLEQRATGRGRVVEVSLLRTGAYVLGWDLGLQMTLGKVARAEPRDRNQAPLMNPYRAADGRWFFFTGLEAARHIGAVCRALGRPELLEDPRFADAARHPAPPGRGHRPPRRDHRRAPARRVGRALRRARACGGPRPRPRPRWWPTPSCWPTTGIVEIDGGAGVPMQRSVNGPVSFSDVGRRAASRPVPALGRAHREVLARARRAQRPPDAVDADRR